MQAGSIGHHSSPALFGASDKFRECWRNYIKHKSVITSVCDRNGRRAIDALRGIDFTRKNLKPSPPSLISSRVHCIFHIQTDMVAIASFLAKIADT